MRIGRLSRGRRARSQRPVVDPGSALRHVRNCQKVKRPIAQHRSPASPGRSPSPMLRNATCLAKCEAVAPAPRAAVLPGSIPSDVTECNQMQQQMRTFDHDRRALGSGQRREELGSDPRVLHLGTVSKIAAVHATRCNTTQHNSNISLTLLNLSTIRRAAADAGQPHRGRICLLAQCPAPHSIRQRAKI